MRSLHAIPSDFLDAGASGLFAVTGEHLPALAEAARASGCEVHLVDLAGARTKDELLRHVARDLRFPDWFGHNWDALADCLADLNWLESAPGRVIVLAHCDARLDDAGMLTEIFDEAAIDWADCDQPFWVFVTPPDASTPPAAA